MGVAVIVCFVLFCLVSGEHRGCPGKWTEGPPIPFYGLNKSYNEYQSANELKSLMCPVETFYQNCFYNGMTEKAQMLVRRHFQLEAGPHSDRCEEFAVRPFMEILRNRKLFFSGDSVTKQLWQALVCKILGEITVPRELIRVSYSLYTELDISIGCPFGASNCQMDEGEITIPEYNASIAYHFDAKYSSGVMLKYINDWNVGRDDILIYNFGIHYNSEMDMSAALVDAFLPDVRQLRDKAEAGENVAHMLKNNFYFLESLPQHFARVDVPNGYFTPMYAASWCDPFSNVTQTKEFDWRNNLLHTHLTPVGVPIIPIADALYSQYDAHLGMDPILFKDRVIADCTHVCNPGPVLPYIMLEMYNRMLRHHRINGQHKHAEGSAEHNGVSQNTKI